MTAGQPTDTIDRRISVAPMMERTDRHCRYLLRLISRHALLYTEMITTGAVLHGDTHRLLRFDQSEHPVALQLGGGDPAELAACAAIAREYGYDEINLNVGCPSNRVRTGRFGACLMADPGLVGRCVAAMNGAAGVPVTVKCRVGIDERDSYDDLRRFVETVAAAGCGVFIVHARKAWLSGLSPKQNREVPPLDYAAIHRLKDDHPQLCVVVNGGVTSAAEAAAQLGRVDGVMIGREAYRNPFVLAAVERRVIGGAGPAPTRQSIVADYVAYVRRQLAEGVPVHRMTRHMLGLFQGVPGARAWRRHLSENAYQSGAGASVIEEAAARVAAARPPHAEVRVSAGDARVSP